MYNTNKQTKKESKWFNVIVKQDKPKVRLVCFPYAGAGANAFNDWSSITETDVELLSMELPGRGRRFGDNLADGMRSIVKQMASEFVGYSDLPYVVFGHSLGALIAWELLRELRARGVRAPNLFVPSGMRSPQYRSRQQLHCLPYKEFVKAIEDYNGTPTELLGNRELMELFVPILKSDFSLSEKHQYTSSPPFDFPIHFMGGLQDYGVNEEEVEGWASHTNNEFQRHMFEGDHFYLKGQSAVDVKSKVRGWLDRVMAGDDLVVNDYAAMYC